MIKPRLNDMLKEVFHSSDVHLKRLDFAKSKANPFIPLTRDNYFTLDDESIAFVDQFIFRFANLQDLMGSRLFPDLLEALAEPAKEKPYIDILNRLEKLKFIKSASGWIQLRKIRNELANEYPALLTERIEGINILFQNLDELKQIIRKCRSVFE